MDVQHMIQTKRPEKVYDLRRVQQEPTKHILKYTDYYGTAVLYNNPER